MDVTTSSERQIRCVCIRWYT